MEPVALDANVVIGLLDPADAHHVEAVRAIGRCDRATLSMASCAYAEALVRPLAAGLGGEVEEFVDDFGVEIIALDRQLAHWAAELRAANRGLRLPDALVLAAARSRDARLLTFDKNLARLAADGAQS